MWRLGGASPRGHCLRASGLGTPSHTSRSPARNPEDPFFWFFRNFRETQRGESNESRQDREAAPDGQSATLMKTRTKHDTTGTARIRIKEFVLSCRVRRVRAVSAPSLSSAGPSLTIQGS